MANNSFGSVLQITTWGESHSPAIGVVIDGCPAGIMLSEQELNAALARRSPGKSAYTSPRNEQDLAKIYSGVFEGKTTGAPISIIIENTDADSSKYTAIKDLLRPGHANYTYLEKYGCFDYRGGGRASARETACRVAASVVAKKILAATDIKIFSYIKNIGGIIATNIPDFSVLQHHINQSEIFCPDVSSEEKMCAALLAEKHSGDSLGGIVECVACNVPVGLGDPVYQKIEAALAAAMLSIPASKGFEIGDGFSCVNLRGSEHNDSFVGGTEVLASNHAGGTLGGITTGMPLKIRVAFKPTSSIAKSQLTTDLLGVAQEFKLPAGSRHDPCVAIRAVPVVEAMMWLVLADKYLQNKLARI